MRQLLIVIALLVVFSAALYVAFLYRGTEPPFSKSLLTKKIYLSNSELEEELNFFLAKKLGIYGGKFEIVDIVDLNTAGLSGTDYILITLKAPNGRLCQIAVSKGFAPWSRWELDEESFSVAELTRYDSGFAGLNFNKETSQWLESLDITADQVFEYFKAHPEIYLKGDAVFIDEKTGKHKLPADWLVIVKPETRYNLLADKENKPVRFISTMKESPADNYWKADYPSAYLGSGYRGYLFGKIKGRD
jgi:hypothetical protein